MSAEQAASTPSTAPWRLKPRPPPSLLRHAAVTKRFGGLRRGARRRPRHPAGGIVSIIGPNGAGKTTFFNVVAGIIDPTAGVVEFQGRAADRAAAPDVARADPVGRYPAVIVASWSPWPRASRTAAIAGSRWHGVARPGAAHRDPPAGHHPARLVPDAARPDGHPAQRPPQRHGGGRHRSHLPEHPPVPEHDRPGERARRHAPPAAARTWSTTSCRSRRQRREEEVAASGRSELLGLVGLAGRSTTSWPRTCRTATSGGSRSRAPWPATQSCSCSTSRPRA